MMRPRVVLWCASILLLMAGPAVAGVNFIRARPTTVSPLPDFLAVADFNGDRRDDLAVVSTRSDEVNVLLGSADGSFASGAVLRLGVVLRTVAAGDLNGDGKPDLAVVDEKAGVVYYFIGKGDGTFRDRRQVSVGQNPYGLTIGNFDNPDHSDLNHNDLAVSDRHRNANRVYVLTNDNKSDPSFKNNLSYPVGSTGPEDTVAADFTGDGNPDIATLDLGGKRVKDVALLVFKQVQSGIPVFERKTNFGVGKQPSDLTVADFNRDGHPDLAVLNRPFDPAFGEVEFLLGQADGLFAMGAPLTVPCPFFTADLPCGARALAVGDFDGDGVPDLAVSQTDPRDETANPRQTELVDALSIFLGRGDGSFTPGPVFETGQAPNAMAVGDFTGEGILDLVVAANGPKTVQVYINASTSGGDKLPGEPCSAGTACASNLCVDGVCCLTECPEGQACNLQGTEGTCTPIQKSPIGSPCDEGNQCDSTVEQPLFCVDQTCCSVASCPSPQRCDIPGLEGNCGAPQGDGKACDRKDQCVSTHCVDGFCCENECASGRCDVPGQQGLCTSELGNGAECSADEQCASGICDFTAQICCALLCDFDEECALDGNSCILNPNPVFTPGAIGAPCETAQDCIETDFCTDGVCCTVAECGTGEVCSVAAGTCATPTPTLAPTPTRTPVGDCVCLDSAGNIIGPCDANGLCSVTSHSGGGCSMTGRNGGTAADILLACLLPVALWLGRRWQVGRVRVRERTQR